MEKVIEKLRRFKTNEESNIDKGETILDINYYGEIVLSKNDTELSNERKEDLYLVKKETNGKIEFEFRIELGIVATINDEGQIQISEEFKELINENEFFLQLNSITPLSLEKLEELERETKTVVDEKMQTIQAEEKTEKGERNTPSKYIENPKDVKIDLSKKITEKENFYDLVPEAREKGVVDVVVRTKNNLTFEIIGVNSVGEEINLQTLEQTEGTNPSKNILEINADGSTVKEDQVSTILKIKNGENEGKQNEGFAIKIGNYGIPEVSYYRRSSELNQYSSIPVNLDNTNQKRTDKDVREYIEKPRNTTTDDNLKRAKDRLSSNEDGKTQLENIDDDLTNDIEDQSEIQIRKAAKRCRISIEEFKQELEKQDGDTLEEKIENAEEAINEEFRGRNRR